MISPIMIFTLRMSCEIFICNKNDFFIINFKNIIMEFFVHKTTSIMGLGSVIINDLKIKILEIKILL